MGMSARDMLAITARLVEERPVFIRLAREEGATWKQIATLLGMSVMGVRNLAKK
jgi:hypothetical protein